MCPKYRCTLSYNKVGVFDYAKTRSPGRSPEGFTRVPGRTSGSYFGYFAFRAKKCSVRYFLLISWKAPGAPQSWVSFVSLLFFPPPALPLPRLALPGELPGKASGNVLPCPRPPRQVFRAIERSVNTKMSTLDSGSFPEGFPEAHSQQK